jgi:hypothetical protein
MPDRIVPSARAALIDRSMAEQATHTIPPAINKFDKQRYTTKNPCGYSRHLSPMVRAITAKRWHYGPNEAEGLRCKRSRILECTPGIFYLHSFDRREPSGKVVVVDNFQAKIDVLIHNAGRARGG